MKRPLIVVGGLALGALFVLGCKQDIGERCEQNSDCSSGLCTVMGATSAMGGVCTTGVTSEPVSDAATTTTTDAAADATSDGATDAAETGDVSSEHGGDAVTGSDAGGDGATDGDAASTTPPEAGTDAAGSEGGQVDSSLDDASTDAGDASASAG
jgi:hypothetical protein